MAETARMITLVENNTRRLEALATDVFSNEKKAARWLKEPNPALGDKRPIDLASSDHGYEAVSDVLLRIESGTLS